MDRGQACAELQRGGTNRGQTVKSTGGLRLGGETEVPLHDQVVAGPGLDQCLQGFVCGQPDALEVLPRSVDVGRAPGKRVVDPGLLDKGGELAPGR